MKSGIANLIVWPKVFEHFRPVVLGARLVGARGRLQRANGVTHLVVEELIDLTGLMQKVARLPAPEVLARGDEVRRPGIDQRGAPAPSSRRGCEDRGFGARGAGTGRGCATNTDGIR